MLRKVLLHHILFAAFAPAIAMHTAFFRLEILFPSLFPARFIRTRHKPIAAVFLDMRLNMTSRDNLVATFSHQRTPYLNLVAHVDQ
jgi:hypothetical protein